MLSWRRLQRLFTDTGAATAPVIALLLPACLFAIGGAVNVSLTFAERARLQDVADSAATGAARELALARADTTQIVAIATAIARARLGDDPAWTVATKVIDRQTAVFVEISGAVSGTIPLPGGDGLWSVDVHSTARISAGPPICLVALDPKAPRTLYLEGSATLTASNCSVFSNSTSPQGLTSQQSASITSSLTCSAGGKVGTKINFTPEPLTDCPPVPDPLADRPAPTDSACSVMNRVVSATLEILRPGTYCGGLKVTNGAIVLLSPGIYVMRDGPLVVDGGATLRGSYVGIYLRGSTSTLLFATASTIDLTAPKDGPMAGLLLFEDRAAPDLREHKIMSDNAHTLLGTIYIPKGRLIVDATKPIAVRSAYTIIVTRRMELYAGPNLVMNTDYGSTPIPVPQGVGNLGGKIWLEN